MLDEDSINRNNTCGMRLFQFASENQLQEMHSIENVGRYERNTFPRFLPAQTFDEKSEWNDIIRIFDTFEKKLYDGLVTKHSPSDEHLNRSPQPESGVKSTGQCPDEAVIVCRSTDSVRKRQLKKYSRRSCERISVEFWLASLQLIQYCDVLHNNGFDNLKFMVKN